MNVLFSGSSSILASALIEAYFRQGHTLFISEAGAETQEAVCDSLQAKIAGKPIDLAFILDSEEIFGASAGRKSLRKHMQLRQIHHRAVSSYLASLSQPPETVISTSSVLIYENHNSQKSVESSPISRQFPATYFHDLEQSAQALAERGIRVVHLRLGKVVSRTAFPASPRLSLLGGYTPLPLGNTSAISWVSMEDTLRAIAYILGDTSLSGHLNITSGDILSPRDFHAPLVERFSPENLVKLPSSFLKLFFGQDTANLIASDSRAIPFKLMESGFFFEDISLQEYLQNTSSHE